MLSGKMNLTIRIIMYKINEELMNCNTLAEMLQVVKKYYDTENCRPGQIGKQIFIRTLDKALTILGAKLRRENDTQR